MNKYYTIFTILIIFSINTSCAIEEIPRQPLLTSPLGLTVKLIDSTTVGTKGFGLYFTAMNPEIYFTGFSIFVSTRKEDFEGIPSDSLFAVIPTLVAGSQARLLTNFTPVSDTNMSIIGSQMSYPARYFYPPPPNMLVTDSDKQDPILNKTSFDSLPPGPGTPPNPPAGPFVSGTTYYFGVYSYSSVDNAYSLPSNIFEITYP